MKYKRNFSLITYNIHKGFSAGRVRFLLPQMRNALTALNPDFVFLQEVQGAHRARAKRIISWPQLPQFEYIAEEIWPYYLYAKNAEYKAGHHGNAILSKLAFDKFENINLSTVSRASRGILHGEIKFSSTSPLSLHLLCVHLGLFKAERAHQLKTLIQFAQTMVPVHAPLLMAGDFNDWRHHISRPLFEELGLEEAFYTINGKHARSFPAIKPALCVDRIYFRGINAIEVQCLHKSPWHLLSDHVPLLARFEFLK